MTICTQALSINGKLENSLDNIYVIVVNRVSAKRKGTVKWGVKALRGVRGHFLKKVFKVSN